MFLCLSVVAEEVPGIRQTGREELKFEEHQTPATETSVCLL